MVQSDSNSNSYEILCMSSLPASIKRIGSKTIEKRWRHRFPHYKSMGAFCCHGNQFWSNLPQNLMHPIPHPSDATHKIWSRLANCFRDIQVWKCGRRTDDGPLVYYKLTLWAFGSGELTSSPKGNDRSPESNVPRSIWPPYATFPPPQWCYT